MYTQVWMSAEVTIGQYIFRNVSAVTIENSWKNIVSRAKITLPNIKEVIQKVIKPGDAVSIKLGYDGSLIEEYSGYVSLVSPSIPVEIECEDEMWKLKQETVSQSWKSVKLVDVLKFLVPDATLQCPDVTLAPFRLDKVTKAMALQKLKDEYALVVYFRGKQLYAGLAYQEVLDTVKFHFQKNLPINQDSLTYRAKTDVKIKVKAISMMPNNTKQEVEVGDTDGETHTLHFFNLSKSELKTQALEKINMMKYDGYRGTLSSFGVPYSIHGMVAEINDDKHPERNGSFFIDSVKISYDNNGFRRTVELGRKAGIDLIL